MSIIKLIIIKSLLLLPLIVTSNEWKIEKFNLFNQDGVMILIAQSLSLPFVNEKITNIHYRCEGSHVIYPVHNCKKGNVTLYFDNVYYDLTISGWVDFQSFNWNLIIENIDETIKIVSESNNKNELNIQLNKLGINELGVLLKYDIDEYIPDSGKISAEINLKFLDELQVRIDYLLEELSWESSDEQFILLDTTHEGRLNLKQIGNNFDLSINNQLIKGEGLFKDIYIFFDDYPISIVSNNNLDTLFKPIKAHLLITTLEAISFDILMANGTVNNPLISFKIDDLNKFYRGFLSSYVEINGVDDLVISGLTHGRLKVENNKIMQATLNFKDLNMQIPSKKILLDNFSAKIDWQDQGEWKTSLMRWDSVLLAGMPFNKSELTLESIGQQVKLKKNTRLPVFDGNIIINNLLLQEIFSPEVSIDFDGELSPISIALITEKMGWPIMTGSLSGKIPGMSKKGQSITFDGFLDLKVFDGDMQISDLSIERLFGVAPVVAGDIKFQLLNLQQITSTFDFGEITGLVDGYVNELRITNWKADRLDAYIHSVKSKEVKQTISQKAIDSISSLGGIQGALSRSFLRFFDYFKYKKIGIGCKLRNAICEMSGLKSSKESYQLIEGKGLPSINIMGFKRFIDWEVFLDRLLNAGYDI